MTIGPLGIVPPPKLQFFIPGTLVPAAGALLFSYAAGTTTKQATYSNDNQTPNTNPIVLDANGECVCFVDTTLSYAFTFAPSTDTDPPTNPYWTVDHIGFAEMTAGFAPLNSPTFTGTPKAPTPSNGDSSTNIATTQFVQNAVASTLSGSPTTTTQAAGDYSTKIATTAFVGNEINRSPQKQFFTSSGSFTPAANVNLITYRIWGAGGGGGAGTASLSSGAGGGGGSYAEGTLSVTPGTPITITIGAGGAGSSGSSPGTGGGTSSIGGAVTCTGGSGGASTASGGATPGGGGGSSSGGGLNLNGTAGQVGQTGTLIAGTVAFQGGAGGSCPMGGSGGPGSIAGNNQGQFPGGGGSGGGPTINGASGASGLVIIEWLEP